MVHIGPRIDGQGGIASVLRAYASSCLAEDYDLWFVGTVGAGSLLRRCGDSVTGVTRALIAVASPTRPLVHVHVSMRGSLMRKAPVVLVARLLGRRVVLHVHGSDFHHYAEGGTWFRRWAVRRTFKAATSVVVLSPEWSERVESFAGLSDAVVIQNPVEIPALVSRRVSPPEVLFLGRLGARKGIPQLLEAIAALQTRGVEASYVLAGDGEVEETRAAVGRLPLPRQVEVPGWLGEAEVEELLGKASIFCLPSFDEGQPVALLQAMAHGLCCVTTPVGGIPDTVVEGEDALLVPPGDSPALVEALQRVIDDRALRERLGLAARAHAIAAYDRERVVERVEALYETLGYPPSKGSAGTAEKKGTG